MTRQHEPASSKASEDLRRRQVRQTHRGGNPPADNDPTDHDAADEDVNDTKRESLADIGRKKMHRR